MKKIKSILPILLIVLATRAIHAQDVRLTVTKVADILAQMPARDNAFLSRLMADMTSLGDAGLKQICDQVLPPGSGDDSKARFAVESFSRYLTRQGLEKEKGNWEKICLGYIEERPDYTVKDFFMKQLQLVGSEISVHAMKKYITDRDLSVPAVSVIGTVGGKDAEAVLSESLKDKTISCAAAIMNTLALMKSAAGVNEFISWSSSGDRNIQAAAYNALAGSGSPVAYPVLARAAKNAGFGWEQTRATSSFLEYAKRIGEKGDLQAMNKICKAVLKAPGTRNTIQYKTEALGIKVQFTGAESVPDIIDALGSQDKGYRNAALQFMLELKGEPVTRRLIAYFSKASREAKPEIIRNLGARKDLIAAPVVASALSDPDPAVRKEAAAAIVQIEGGEALNPLLDFMGKSPLQDDQDAAKNSLKTILNSKSIPLLETRLKESPDFARRSLIELLGWSRDERFFPSVFQYASSGDENVRNSAFRALSTVAAPSDQQKLIGLLGITDNVSAIADLQIAIANAANKITDPEKRSSELLKSLTGFSHRERIIPVLALTGGREALASVLREFESGSVEMRDVCFRALSTWKDFTALSALYEICVSGNKTYENPAFEGYVKLAKSAPVPDDQKLLLFRKIMPCARSADRKNMIIDYLADIHTYTSLFYTGSFLDDPGTSSHAAKAVMLIALPPAGSKAGMYGKISRGILTKALPLLSGPESEYNRELLNKYLASMPADEGFVPLFNGTDLSGWHGLVENPVARARMRPAELANKQAEADKRMTENWSVKDGCIWFSGNGDNLCSTKDYGDFEMYVDWKITKKGDSGIYLRGSPQVQIWDTSRVEVGAQVGSGGLYNNQKNESKPLVVADNPIDEWNTFRIIMTGEKVSVWLNGILVVDNVTLENYWDRSVPIFPKGPIELQAHGNQLAFRDIFVREINENEYNLTADEKADGFVALFNGRNIDNWTGDKEAYAAEDGMIVVKQDKGTVGNLYTDKEYSDFIFRFEFQLTPAANNGIGIRAPLAGDAAYVGMEIQVLDDSAPVYANLQPYQYHGSVYGVIPSRRGFQKPLGEWNYEEISATGTHIKVTLNGTVIVDGDIAGPRDNGTMDHNNHPGLRNNSGHIGFLGHGSVVKFRNIRVKDLSR